MAPCIKEEGCFSSIGRNFLIGVNLLTAIIGLLLTAGGAYLYIEYDSQFSDLVSTNAVLGVIIAGFMLFVMSMFGIYGVWTGKKPILVFYLVVVVALIAVQVAAAVIFLDYLDFIEASDEADSSDLSESTEVAINNFIYRSYHTCCFSEIDNCPSVLLCEDVLFCDELVGPVDNSTACIVDEIGSGKSVDLAVCTALAQFNVEGEALVGPVESGNDVTCGGGAPEAFEAALTTWLTENINFFGYGAIGLGALEVLIVGFVVALLFARPNLIPEAQVVSHELESGGSDIYAEPIRVNSRASKDTQRSSTSRTSVNRNSVNRAMASTLR